MSGLRILITNNTLGRRLGTEMYVRDLATALLERGHKPIAYSTQPGEVAEELRLATIPVIDNLAALPTPPDIIHGQHHLDTMTALLSFPNTPAIYFCHGWLPWEEAPPHFPRILRYVAIDEVCRDRLVYESAIPAESVSVSLNFVDLDRFKPRGRLPLRPRRALVFSNNAYKNSYLDEVRRACADAGIALDVIGLKSGEVRARPEDSLGDYDLVFAKARAALEALAVGTAVVLCDATGAGPMVTLAELDRLRPLNFGIRALSRQITPAVIAQEIARYDPVDAAAVSARIRATAGRDAAIDRIIELYREAIAEHAAAGPRDLEAEERAAAAYLRMITPRVKEVYQLRQDCERLEAETAGLSRYLAFRLRERLRRSPLLAMLYRALRRG